MGFFTSALKKYLQFVFPDIFYEKKRLLVKISLFTFSPSKDSGILTLLAKGETKVQSSRIKINKRSIEGRKGIKVEREKT